MVLISDSLGLYVSPNCVLAGHGNQAVLYSSNKKLKLPTGLRRGKVHGFAVTPVGSSQDLVLIFSENEYSIILHTRSNDTNPFKLLYEGETKDWINAAKFLGDKQTNNKKTFVLHMAHSALLYLEFDLTATAECRALGLARCSDSSILYCTRLHGECFEDLAIISGNAFGELLLWQPQNAIDAKAESPVKTYPVLLRLQAHNGVIFSIDFNMASQLLVTTSDDRSVKFWKIQKLESWQGSTVKPMYSCFGHSSRVMCAVIFEVDGQAYVASGGEDSFVCVWSLSGDLLLKRRQHFGSPIWRIGFRAEDNTLYSTSSSGNLAAESLEELFCGHRSAPAANILSEISGAATDEFIRNVRFLSGQLIVGLSSANQLYYMRVTQDNWQLVDSDFPTYKRTVLEVSGDIIATCGHRRITIYRHNAQHNVFDQLFDGETGLTGTIRSFHFLSKDLYLVSDDLGKCVSLKAHDLSLDSPIELGNYREAWLTAALLISERYLLLGDRRGHVMLYQRCSNNNTFSLKATLKHLHGKMGTNFFKLLRADEDAAHVLSGGHEPLLKYLHLELAECTLTIGQRESIPLSWVEACPRRDVMLGFNDNHIVAWSRRYDVLAQLACGGGHRCWDYLLSDDDILAILFVKRKRVFLYRHPLYNRIAKDMAKLELNSWHTRNCNSARLLPHKGDNKGAHPLIVSAGDDNIIKLSKVIDGTVLRCAEVHSHVSTVRCLQAHRLASSRNSTTWLIFSVGGRSRLCINQLAVSSADNECQVTELCTHILQKSSTVEARLMAIDIVQEEASHFSLYVAVADGEIRHYRWHLNKPSELHLQTVVDIERCPLTLQWIKSKALVLITTTSGEIYAFERTLATKCLQLRLHMAGINAIDTCMDDKQPQRLHILSGGDDENIKYTVLDLDSMTVEYKTEFLHLHNAQVNALSIQGSAATNESGESEMYAFTCGIDQQIFRIDLRRREYRRIGHTSIADIKGMLIDDNQRHMYFYGSGFEIVEINSC
ncbi:hypothetical protein KR032_000961 [Drosophila birchii]|nr:hypothetical protein KR032_000961 [Drosophila birchii]